MEALVALESVKPKPDQKYTVLVYFLTSEEVIETKNVYGGIIIMGTYANKDLATDAANGIIEATDHRNIMIIKTCEWNFLKPEAYRDSKVIPATRDKLFIDEARVSAELDLERYKTDILNREVLAEQALKMSDPDCVENYKYRQHQLSELRQRIETFKSQLKQLESDIAAQLKLHPEFLES